MRLAPIVVVLLLAAACSGDSPGPTSTSAPTADVDALSDGLIQPCDIVSSEDVQGATGLNYSETSRVFDHKAATCTFATSDESAATFLRVDVRVSTAEFEQRIGLNEPDSPLQPLETVAERSYWSPERRTAIARQDDLMIQVGFVSPDFTDPDALTGPVALLVDTLVDGIEQLGRETIVVGPPGGTDAEAFAEPAPTDPVDRTTLGWVENIEERAARGDWTLGEGIVETLQVFVGEADLQDVHPTYTNDPLEGTGVLRLAREYLLDGHDADSMAEIDRLLDDLFLSRERLDAMVVQNQVSAAGPLAHGGAPQFRQPQEDCDKFFVGITTPGVSQCLQREVVTVEGVEFRVYLPAPTLPDVGWQRSHVDLVIETLQNTIPVYRRYGNVPSGVIVFSVTPGPRPRTLAETNQGGCAMRLFRTMQGLSPEHFRQALAHELAHCYFTASFPEQIMVYQLSAWLEESGADYLSGIVYDDVNLEQDTFGTYLGLEFSAGVLDRTYSNAVWVQHIANTTGPGGPDAFRQFFAALPTGSARSDQAGALSGRPGVGEVHHDFAERVSQGSISDPGGGFWRPSRFFNARVGADNEGSIHNHVLRPFGLDRILVDVDAGTAVTLRLDAPEEVRSSVSPAAESGATSFSFEWRRFGGEITFEASCDEDSSFWILTTSAVPANNPYAVEVTKLEDLASECDEASAANNPPDFITGIDLCLVGSWKLDTDSYVKAKLATDNIVADSLDQDLAAEVTLRLEIDGSAELTIDQWIEVYTYDGFDSAEESVGVGRGRWGADGLRLNARWPDLDFAFTVESGPFQGNVLEAPPAYVLPVGPGGYICRLDSFTFTEPPSDPVPGFAPVTWRRQ